MWRADGMERVRLMGRSGCRLLRLGLSGAVVVEELWVAP